jgi:hypothetical protein
MRRVYATFLLVSLVCNAYLLSANSEMQVGKVHKVIVKELKDGNSTQVSENTSLFVMDFVGRINQCDTFLWAVSENNREIKYTIWFAKENY